MGEGRGKLEALIGELQAKKADLEKLIEEYELMLPHLAKARAALDEAGITDSGSRQAAAAAPEAPAPAAPPVEQPAAAPAAAPPADGEAAADEDGEAAPARRSIASLVAEDEAAGDEATH